MGPAELLRRALALDEQLEADHVTLSVSHNNLGLVLRQLGTCPGRGPSWPGPSNSANALLALTIR